MVLVYTSVENIFLAMTQCHTFMDYQLFQEKMTLAGTPKMQIKRFVVRKSLVNDRKTNYFSFIAELTNNQII